MFQGEVVKYNLREAEVTYAPPLYQQKTKPIQNRPELQNTNTEIPPGYARLKRSLDIICASTLLLFLSPIMAMVWCGVKISSGGPGLFWSPRIGQDGRTFKMPKFRSMRKDTRVVSRESLFESKDAITPLGYILRKTSLDELPQLISVLKGDMSFIGPRPLLPRDAGQVERQKYPSIQKIKPGITGLAQVRGRNNITPQKKARLDAFYASRLSLKLDFRILLETVKTVITGKDIM